MLIMRELTGGLYFGERKTIEENGVRKAIDTLTYDENEIRRIAIKGFDIARKRKRKLPAWIKPMSWIPPDCGERSWKRSRRIILTLLWNICW